MAHAVNLLWGASPSSNVGYNVFRGNSPGGESSTPLNAAPLTSTNTNITYADTNVTPGTTYYYKVDAVDLTTGEASSFSNEVNATVPLPPPPSPTGALQVSSVS